MSQSRVNPGGPLRSVISKLRRPSGGEPLAPPELRPVLAALRDEHPKADLSDVVRAYRVAYEMHDGQLRKSGEPFITHPLGVAMILADMGMDPVSVAAAMLHDAVEDTEASLQDLRDGFGDEIAEIVDGLTKLSKIGFVSLEHARAENYRKMMVAMARDVRVIIVKLADRLHNMRTLDSLSAAKQELKATETLEIYVPLAARLGMQQLKVELEDLGFKYRYPKRFDEIVDLTDRRQPERDRYLTAVVEELGGHLEKAKIRAEVAGRAKNYFSIYQKMVGGGREFDDIFDLVGVRIVVDEMTDCYTALGVVHTLWVPLPGRFKDYIAQPKFNLYQSLHTTVMGPQGKSLEIQIRTQVMHRMAEYGIAAHWRYKEKGKDAPKGSEVPWLGEIVETFREARDPREFMESLRLDLFHDEVFCFTPKGDVECLPRGATPLDFAYAIHTEVGHRCVGARVNGKLVPLDTKLESGDSIEVLTTKAKDAGPKQDWLNLVKTSRARSRIKAYLTAHRREEARESGKDMFVKLLRKEGLAMGSLDDDAWRVLLSDTRTSGPETLYEALGDKESTSEVVIGVLRKIFHRDEIEIEQPEPAPANLPKRRRREDTSAVVVPGVDDVAVKLARCCAPVPGDTIFGYVTRGKGVSVHRTDCPNAQSLQDEDRVVDVEWDTTHGGTFVVTLQMASLDRPGLLRDVTDTLAEAGVMILSSQSWAKRDGTARLRFAFELGDVTHLDHIVRAVNGVEGVFDIYRVLPLQARPER